MPFSLETAPVTFHRAMDSVFRGLQGLHCLVYLDKVIIFSKSLQEHTQKIRAVFDLFRETNLKIQLDKSSFSMQRGIVPRSHNHQRGVETQYR